MAKRAFLPALILGVAAAVTSAQLLSETAYGQTELAREISAAQTPNAAFDSVDNPLQPDELSPLDHALVDAFQRRDYETVLSIVRPLAEGGNTQAQILLGRLYGTGTGL